MREDEYRGNYFTRMILGFVVLFAVILILFEGDVVFYSGIILAVALVVSGGIYRYYLSKR